MKNYRKAVEAIAERMVAAEDTRELRVADGILQYIDSLPRPIHRDIQRLIMLFEYLPPLVIFRFRRFSSLQPVDQDRYIEAWGASPIGLLRTGFRVLKNLSVSTYYQNPASWKALGYKR
jgi:hypothetical protein